jgi:hypothetical protein
MATEAVGRRASDRLLNAIRRAVLEDEAPPGLQGRLRIGVAHPTGDDWLEVRLEEERAEAGAPSRGGADVSLLVGDYEAKRLLLGRGLPHAPLFSIQGDEVLLSRFVERYLPAREWAGLHRPRREPREVRSP